jgi:hypothetical protein
MNDTVAVATITIVSAIRALRAYLSHSLAAIAGCDGACSYQRYSPSPCPMMI